jgi:hypothetical protein
MGAIKKYAMFPVRLGVAFIGVLISMVMVATGTSWRKEWADLDIRGYLFGGHNWNVSGF